MSARAQPATHPHNTDTFAQDRRTLLVGSLALASAVTASAAASELPGNPGKLPDPDAVLLALREPWQQVLREELRICDLLGELDRRCFARSPKAPERSEWRGTYEAYRREHARVIALREAIRGEEGEADIERAREEMRVTRDAVLDRIAATPARTLRGLAFKAEVSAEWEHDRDDLVQSVMDDIATMATSA